MKKLWFCLVSLCTLILVGCNNGDDSILDIPDGWSYQAVSLAVTPKTSRIPAGFTQQLEADALLDNGTTVRVTTNSALTWSSSDTNIATIDAKGLVTGLKKGSVTITAKGVNADGSTVSDTATIDVTDALVQSLQVTPPSASIAKGLTQQYTAVAQFSDHTTQDVTSSPSLTWSSSDEAIATIDNNGVATGNKEGGPITITATLSDKGKTYQGNAQLTVTNAIVTRLQVTPVKDTTVVGLSKPFTATAMLSDKSSVDVTNDPAVTWSTSDVSIATITSGATSDNGVATGVKEGEVTVTASGVANGQTFEGSATLTVIDAKIVGLAVTPKTESTPVGLTKAFTATATLDNSLTMDVTDKVSWSTNDNAIASITTGQPSDNGVATGVTTGTVTVTASIDSDGTTYNDDAQLTVTDAIITSLQVTPAKETTPVGLTKPFTATAYFSDGVTTQDVTNEPAISWTSSDTTIATITSSQASDNGVATGVKEGEVTITAKGKTAEGTDVSGTATLTVTAAVPTSLSVTPKTKDVAKGLTQQFTAKITYSNKTSADVTKDPATTWASDSDNATIDSDGLATGAKLGTSTITATNGSLSDSGELTVTDAVVESLQVTPATASVAKGLTQNFTATAMMSDGTSPDVTNDSGLVWSSDTPAKATVTTGLTTGNGVATGVDKGVANITATLDGQSASGQLTVTDPIPTKLTVTPTDASIAKGLEQQFKAELTYSDDSTADVTADAATSWTSDDTATATVNSTDAKGMAKGVKEGSANIQAAGTYGGTPLQDAQPLTVTAAGISSIAVTPASADVVAGMTQQYTATATMTDGSTTDITDDAGTSWTSSDDTTATVSTTAGSKGLATGQKEGGATITATKDGSSGEATINVTAAELVSIKLSPDPLTVATSATGDLTATGTFTDGTTSDVTADVEGWTGQDTSIATVVDGKVTGVKAGSTTTTASIGKISSQAAVINVTESPKISYIDIRSGTTYQDAAYTCKRKIEVTAHWSDGTTTQIPASDVTIERNDYSFYGGMWTEVPLPKISGGVATWTAPATRSSCHADPAKTCKATAFDVVYKGFRTQIQLFMENRQEGDTDGLASKTCD
ncbi:TPA: beta strand repeat-containing protein [Photobacterium damselae]